MVQLTDQVVLSQDDLSLYYAPDPHLASLPVLIFHGPSTTTNSTLNSSRIQVHILTSAGFQSFPRITISPNSPFYQSVNHLPREKQGDEICRGIAFGLLKYFRELPETVKSGLIIHAASARKRPGAGPALFGEQHAADIAAAMLKVENIEEVIHDIEAALRPQHIHHLDVDLVLPPGSITPLEDFDEHWEEDGISDPVLKQYGIYAPLVKLFGEVTFLPTSKIRRAPSRPTSLNRSKTFQKDAKLSLRREMGELVDTEERYVIKMNELVNHMADEYRDRARSRSYDSSSPSEADLEKLFPKSLDRILQINSLFLQDIQKVMNETEEEAMQDLEAPLAGSNSSRHGGSSRAKDPTGALRFAKALLEWFPQFTECYQDYMHASQDFPQILTSFIQQQSSFSRRVQQTGEQRLRSAIIEPVQRLPRYSLFIDNIINYLPVAHPAVPHMLRARDMITSICSMDPPTDDKLHIVNRLRNLVESWPTTLRPRGRLVTAVDFTELGPPFHLDAPFTSAGFPRSGMLLFFADCVVVLKKSRDGAMSARGLVAEVDKPSAAVMIAPVTAAAGGQKYNYELQFSGWHVLGDTRFTMSADGRCIWMSSLYELKDAGMGRDRNQAATVRYFILKGAYEGKAVKLTDEITKARLEGRFSEAERESGGWSYRSVTLAAAEISLHTAVFEEGIDSLIDGRKEPAPIRIVVDHEKGTKGAPVGHYGVDIVANVKVIGGGIKYRVEVDGLNDKVFVDEIGAEHVLPIFAKRIVGLLGPQYNQSNPALTAPFISLYTKILKAIHVQVESDKSRPFRPPSPVKILSSLLSSGFGASSLSLNASTSSHSKSSRPQMGEIPSMQAPLMQRSNSNRSTHSIQDVDGRSSVRAGTDERPANPLVRLEETFTGYIAALQSRKGNIIGRTMLNRSMADELSINALYNTFIENPFDTRATSEVTVDVLFVAFEKYLRMAWKDQMGQVMPVQTLNALQERATRLKSADFAAYVKEIFGEMAPQNRRAFIAIIKLLADLLEGCGNDGDRGALTAAFAELLVIDANPHDYINLLDRMVEDADHLFEDIGPGAIAFGNGGNSTYGSMSGARSTHSATGSLTSNASSLRRKFDHLLRQNSTKNESDSRPSMWRTLSKNSRNAPNGGVSASSSLSKASINRSRSIESPRRPMSRDRPTVFGTFDERPSSSHSPGNRLSTIGASPPAGERADPVKAKKKSRRSSLPDLMKLSLGDNSPLAPMSPPNLSRFNTSPRTPSPTKIPVAGGIMDRGRQMMYRSGSPAQKENIPISSAPDKLSNTVEHDSGPVKELWPAKVLSKNSPMSSNIPTLRGAPRDLGSSTSPLRPTSSSTKVTEKFRLRSPQKLRERVGSESKSISEAETSLRMELAQISENLGRVNTMATTESDDLIRIEASVNDIRDRIPNITKELNGRLDGIKSDLEKSLQASEFKVKGLDQLCKESSAENELLYEKFNGELGKIVRALKGKGKEEKEELVSKLKDSTEEIAKVKKENQRLKREVLQLRTLLKGTE